MPDKINSPIAKIAINQAWRYDSPLLVDRSKTSGVAVQGAVFINNLLNLLKVNVSIS
jgi:hypothetical protein